jgi:hypothetical protein
LHVAVLVGTGVRRMFGCFIDGLGVVSDGQGMVRGGSYPRFGWGSRDGRDGAGESADCRGFATVHIWGIVGDVLGLDGGRFGRSLVWCGINGVKM